MLIKFLKSIMHLYCSKDKSELLILENRDADGSILESDTVDPTQPISQKYYDEIVIMAVYHQICPR